MIKRLTPKGAALHKAIGKVFAAAPRRPWIAVLEEIADVVEVDDTGK